MVLSARSRCNPQGEQVTGLYLTMTTTYGQVLIKSFYNMEELMAAYKAICERPVHEGCEITVSMSDWYGDPYRRDIRMTMRFMGAPVLMEEGDGWVARGVLPVPEFGHDPEETAQDLADRDEFGCTRKEWAEEVAAW